MAKNKLYKIIKSGSVILGIYLVFNVLHTKQLHLWSTHNKDTQLQNSAEDFDQIGEFFIHRKLNYHSLINYTKTILRQNNINVYNLTTSVPLDVEAFDCVQSATTPKFFICLYEPQIDKFISNYLKNGGIWEASITSVFTKALDVYPNSVVVDIGANIGYYSFLSCVKDHAVIAIEPVHNSLVRFHRGALLNHCQNQIILLQNALYNRLSEITMTTNENNQGGVWIDQKRETREIHSTIDKAHVARKTVMTTTLNELLYVRPLSQAILKIDIEGFECKVFEKGRRFLELVHVPYIFMEWHKLYINRDRHDSPCPSEAIQAMIDTLVALGYSAFELHTGFKLDLTQQGDRSQQRRQQNIWRIDDTYWQHYTAPDLKPPY